MIQLGMMSLMLLFHNALNDFGLTKFRLSTVAQPYLLRKSASLSTVATKDLWDAHNGFEYPG